MSDKRKVAIVGGAIAGSLLLIGGLAVKALASSMKYRGNNYIRAKYYTWSDGYQYHSTFDPGLYDPASIDSALNEMANYGYNIVSVFLNYMTIDGGFSQGIPTLDSSYLSNLSDFLSRAKSYGLKTAIRAQWPPPSYNSIISQVPSNPNVMGYNMIIFHQGYLNGYSQYLQDLATGIKSFNQLGAVAYYDLFAEVTFSATDRPFQYVAGPVDLLTGTYNMSDNTDRQKAEDDGIIYWANQLRTSLRQVDPSAKTGVSVFSPRSLGCPTYNGVYTCSSDNRYPPRLSALNMSDTDYLLVDSYPTTAYPIQSEISSLEIGSFSLRKPLMLQEFGAAAGGYPDINSAVQALKYYQIETCQKYGFTGWQLWTWDCSEQPALWNALSAGGAINTSLSPKYRPDPCA